jgi:transposase-like protein
VVLLGKRPFLGIRERGGAVKAIVLPDTKAKTIKGELNKRIEKGSTLYTDEFKGYKNNKFNHKVVNHSVKQFINGMAHTNGIESFWALLKRGHYGTYHKMSRKHLQKYVDEFAYRQNEGNVKHHTMERIDSLIDKSKGKRLMYKRLTGNNDYV